MMLMFELLIIKMFSPFSEQRHPASHRKIKWSIGKQSIPYKAWILHIIYYTAHSRKAAVLLNIAIVCNANLVSYVVMHHALMFWNSRTVERSAIPIICPKTPTSRKLQRTIYVLYYHYYHCILPLEIWCLYTLLFG